MNPLTFTPQGGLAEGKIAPDSSYVPPPKFHVYPPPPDGRNNSVGNLHRSVNNITKHLKGFKKLDLFQPARVDPQIPIEETVKTLGELVKEGKFDYIGLSECSAETLRRANAVCLLLRTLI
jgi:aryl-alcohol dehydrogenase-like predicted oxidoreductase